MSTDGSDNLLAHVAPIFEDAAFANHLGIVLTGAGPGWCETALVAQEEHLQQHRFVHAGVVTTLADHTAGGAARAAVPPGSDVLTIEFKMNFLRPATGRRFAAKGRALRAGKRIAVAESEVYAVDDGRRTLIAKCISTLSVMPQRERLRRP